MNICGIFIQVARTIKIDILKYKKKGMMVLFLTKLWNFLEKHKRNYYH